MMSRNFMGWAVAGLCLFVGQATDVLADMPVPGFVKEGRLTVCTNPGTPPMTYMEEAASDRPIGIDVEIADALGRLWKAETSYSTSAFSGLLTSLASGRCGMMISGYYLKAERGVAFDMSGYLETSAVIVTAGSNADIKAPEDLSGKAVVIEAGTTIYEDVVKALNVKFTEAGRPLATLSSYPTQTAASEQVLLGRADANVSDVVEASMRAKQTDGKLKIAYAYPPQHVFAIYTVKNPENAAAVRAGLKQLRKDGTLARIAAKYGLSEEAFAVVDKF